MIARAVKFKMYSTKQSFSLRIPAKILYLKYFNNSIVIPKWLFYKIPNLYTINEDISLCNIETEMLISERHFKDIDLYLKCESEVEYAKLKLKHEKI